MKHLQLFGVLIGALISSCESNSIEQKIKRRIDGICMSPDSCTIAIKDVTNFDWDKLYVFKYVATWEEVKRILGVDYYNNHMEFTRKLIFMSGNKIAYQENLPTEIESLKDGEVVFDISDTANFKVYYFDEALFKVKKEEFSKGVYFQLTQVKK